MLPAAAACLPARLMNRFLWTCAGIRWLFPGSSQAIASSERICFQGHTALRRKWAWTTLVEAAEAWRLIFRLHPRLSIEGQWPRSPGFIAAGMHHGIGINALWHMRRAGLNPRFVYRPVQRRDLPGRPVKFFWYRLRTRLIGQLCPTGAIPTGGATREIAETLRNAQATPVMLFDTPAQAGDDWLMQLGQGEIPLRSGGARLLSRSSARVCFFSVAIDERTGRGKLNIKRLDERRPIEAQIMDSMEEALAENPGQWLLWRGVDGLFRTSGETGQGR